MLDLNKLHVFAIVAEEGSFSTAARRLYVSQSAVSQHIKDLESSLGQQLFQRGARGVHLTSAGETLHSYAQQILALVTQAENALTDINHIQNGRISLGATPGAAIYLAPDWVQRFRASYPQLTVTLQTGVTAQIVADVLAQRLDLGIIEGEPDATQQTRLGWLELDTIEQIVVVGPNHPWWQTEHIQLSDLNQRSFIVRQVGSQSRQWLESVLRQHHIEPIIGAEFDNLESIKRAVAAGICLSILPGYVIHNDIIQGSLHPLTVTDHPLHRSLRLIWDRRQRFSPLVWAFVESLSQQYPALQSLLSQRD